MVRRTVGRWWLTAAAVVVAAGCSVTFSSPTVEQISSHPIEGTTTTRARTGTTRPRTTTTKPPPPSSLHLVYAVPSDAAPVAGRAQAIRHEAQVVGDFYAGQLAGRRPRLAQDPTTGDVAVTETVLPWTKVQLETTASLIDGLHTWLKAQRIVGDDVVPAIYLEGKGTLDQDACGWAYWEDVDRDRSPTHPPQAQYLMIPMPNCDIYPTTWSSWPQGGTYLLAHEIGHLLGAVDDRAPNALDGGHTGNDPADLMYQGEGERNWDALQLDPGNDDYLGHGRPDLVDITNSPLLLPA